MTVFSDDIITDLPLHLSEEVGEIFMIQFLFAKSKCNNSVKQALQFLLFHSAFWSCDINYHLDYFSLSFYIHKVVVCGDFCLNLVRLVKKV